MSQGLTIVPFGLHGPMLTYPLAIRWGFEFVRLSADLWVTPPPPLAQGLEGCVLFLYP